MDDRKYWLGFSVFPGIGPKRFTLLLRHFGSAKAAWEAKISDLEKIIGKSLTGHLGSFRKSFSIEIYSEKLREKDVNFLLLNDEAYPALLKQISDPPFVLYVKGQFRFDDSDHPNIVAIVGTRKVTSYGREVTEQFTRELVAAGFVVVSGLAYGVDSVAHNATLAENGKTVAVLGCGVDCCYPRSNQTIYEKILAKGGAIVSEFPLGMQPSVGSFPSRNRIIAGLSLAVIVTEGAQDSGALYTAQDAFEINRPVFAVPGPITSRLSEGPHKLIAKGAKLVTSVEDILNSLMAKGKGPHFAVASRGEQMVNRYRAIVGDTLDEQIIIDLLQNEQLHFDELVQKTGLESSKLGILMSMMEMKGLVSNMGGVFHLTY